jgi:hypothetical protein
MVDAPPSEPLLVPDRPDLSNGTVIVPRGGAQLEFGVEAATFPRERPAEAFALTTSLRIGVAENVELRVAEGAPLRRLTPDDDHPALGFGIKARLLETDAGSTIGLQSMIEARPYLLGAPPSAPTLAVTFIGSHVFGPLAAIDVNVAGRIDPFDARTVSTLAAASVGLQLHRRVLFFAEGFVIAEERPTLLIVPGCDSGLIIGITRWLSADVSVRGADLGVGSQLVVIAGLTAAWLARDRRSPPLN